MTIIINSPEQLGKLTDGIVAVIKEDNKVCAVCNDLLKDSPSYKKAYRNTCSEQCLHDYYG